MRWTKLGRIYTPDQQNDWSITHASVPVAEPIGGDLFRVYFSTRDSRNRSHTGYVVINIYRPNIVLEISEAPVLAPGELGAFDDSGAMATWLTRRGDSRYMYYIGWNLGVTVPFRNSIGLAVSHHGEPFVRRAAGPIVDRTMTEPHFCASCCVLSDGDLWRMWYLSCTGWSVVGNVPRHHYHIKYAESADGIQWRREGDVAIDFIGADEYAISRPSVIHDGSSWKMWYSYRGESYRIGYAVSDDGRVWKRCDEDVGIDVSATGWDSEMIEYPFVFDYRDQRFMLYNGNGFGRSGFGLAVLES